MHRRGYLINRMPACHYTKYVSCPVQSGECPLDDWGFLSAIDYYLGRAKGYKSVAKEFDYNRLYEDLHLEIAVALKSLDEIPDWELRLYSFFEWGRIVICRQFCDALRESQYRWCDRASPPGYPWLGRRPVQKKC